jgi:hypothetical protein
MAIGGMIRVTGMNKELSIVAIGLIFITLGAIVCCQIESNPTQQSPTDRRVFTWISHSINQSTAEWLTDLGFTDVAVRYVSDAELNNSRAVLGSVELRLWSVLDPWTTNSSLSSYTIFDDIHLRFETLTMQEKQEFLYSVRSVDHVSLTLYGPSALETVAGLNLSGLDLDVYSLPRDLNLTVLNTLKAQARSVGVYLWVWKGHGLTWGNITQAEVERAYSIAEEVGATRFFVWMGSETDEKEQGMSESSLINYPSWFPIIKQLNEEFKK